MTGMSNTGISRNGRREPGRERQHVANHPATAQQAPNSIKTVDSRSRAEPSIVEQRIV
jgi:hypothetical protein